MKRVYMKKKTQIYIIWIWLHFHLQASIIILMYLASHRHRNWSFYLIFHHLKFLADEMFTDKSILMLFLYLSITTFKLNCTINEKISPLKVIWNDHWIFFKNLNRFNFFSICTYHQGEIILDHNFKWIFNFMRENKEFPCWRNQHNRKIHTQLRAIVNRNHYSSINAISCRESN